MTIVDPWEKWRAALANPRQIGSGKLVVHPSEPWTGFFRVRRKDGNWEPVQFWQDDLGLWYATRSGKPVDPDRIVDLFQWAVRQPISELAFDRATAGNGWADEPERTPGIGDNSGEADPFDALNIEWLGEKELVEGFLKIPITSKDEADRAAIWATRLNGIAKRADKLHGDEKAPVIVAGRRVDSKWRELREQPSGMAILLKRHQDKWLREQERLERERVAAAAVEAERLRIEAEEAAAKARTPDDVAEAGAKVAAAQEAEREATYQRPQAGRTGAKTSLRTFRTGKIVDFDTFLMAAKDHDEIREAAQTTANRLARAKVTLAGMEIVEEQRTV
jgi:hypothetical protein